MSLIVVGNGPSLNGSGLGPTIDSYDRVFRFNNFVTKGFEADVGEKVTDWARGYISNLEPGSEEFERTWFWCPPGSHRDFSGYVTKAEEKHEGVPLFRMPNAIMWELLEISPTWRHGKRTKGLPHKGPSCGLVTLLTLSKLYALPIQYVGVGEFGNPPQHHYWRGDGGSGHSHQAEGECLSYMEEQGWILKIE